MQTNPNFLSSTLLLLALCTSLSGISDLILFLKRNKKLKYQMCRLKNWTILYLGCLLYWADDLGMILLFSSLVLELSFRMRTNILSQYPSFSHLCPSSFMHFYALKQNFDLSNHRPYLSFQKHSLFNFIPGTSSNDKSWRLSNDS